MPQFVYRALPGMRRRCLTNSYGSRVGCLIFFRAARGTALSVKTCLDLLGYVSGTAIDLSVTRLKALGWVTCFDFY